MKFESCIVHDERLKCWDAGAFHIVSYINLHSSSHSSFTLIPPSVSYFCVTVPSGSVSRSSICQHRPEGVWQSGWGPGERHQTWDAGLGSAPPSLHTPFPSLFELLALPSVCAWFGAGCRSRGRKKGCLPMTNDNLRINTREEGGWRKRAESLFHHPWVPVGPLINPSSLPFTVFWRLSFIIFILIHSLFLTKMLNNSSLDSVPHFRLPALVTPPTIYVYI